MKDDISSFHFDKVLGAAQKDIWDKLNIFSNDFYMAGGTGLALQLGHRMSVDVDKQISIKEIGVIIS